MNVQCTHTIFHTLESRTGASDAAGSLNWSLIWSPSVVPCPMSTARKTDSQTRCLLPVPGPPRNHSSNMAVQHSSIFMTWFPWTMSRRAGLSSSWRPTNLHLAATLGTTSLWISSMVGRTRRKAASGKIEPIQLQRIYLVHDLILCYYECTPSLLTTTLKPVLHYTSILHVPRQQNCIILLPCISRSVLLTHYALT